MTVEVKISEAEFRQANALLQQVDRNLRQQAVPESLRRASRIVVDEAKVQVPQPGYPGDKPDKKPLKETLTSKVEEYQNGTVVAIVGAAYPAGAHAHLVELGHEVWVPYPPFQEGADAFKTGKRSQPNPFLERAADLTHGRQVQAIIGTLQEAAKGTVTSTA